MCVRLNRLKDIEIWVWWVNNNFKGKKNHKSSQSDRKKKQHTAKIEYFVLQREKKIEPQTRRFVNKNMKTPLSIITSMNHGHWLENEYFFFHVGDVIADLMRAFHCSFSFFFFASFLGDLSLIHVEPWAVKKVSYESWLLAQMVQLNQNFFKMLITFPVCSRKIHYFFYDHLLAFP